MVFFPMSVKVHFSFWREEQVLRFWDHMGVAVRLNRYLKNGLKIFFKSLKESHFTWSCGRVNMKNWIKKCSFTDIVKGIYLQSFESNKQSIGLGINVLYMHMKGTQNCTIKSSPRVHDSTSLMSDIHMGRELGTILGSKWLKWHPCPFHLLQKHQVHIHSKLGEKQAQF